MWDCDVLTVAGLRLEYDFDTFRPLHLLAEEHDVFKVVKRPQISHL